MFQHGSQVLPDEDHVGELKDSIIEFWNSLRCDDNPGSATWEDLETIEREVTDCLAGEPRDVLKASRLTAKAMFLMSGQMRN